MSESAWAQCCQTGPGKITVNATGTSYQAPNKASVSAGVIAEAPTAQDAMQRNAQQMNTVINALLAAGIQKRHIQTSNLSLHPVYQRSKLSSNGREVKNISGYRVNNTVSAQTDNMDNIGPMLDALVRAGANNINNVSFGIKDPTNAKSIARRDAIKAAQKKAEEMAAAAGVRLGPLINMSENNARTYPQAEALYNMAMSAAADTPIATGEQTISVTVTMVFQIDP